MKKISRSIVLKLIAFILIIVSVFGIISVVYEIEDIRYFEAFTKESFIGSDEYARVYWDSMRYLISALDWHDSTREYNESMDFFSKNPGIYYYATDGTHIVTNTSMKKNDIRSLTYCLSVSSDGIVLKPHDTKIRTYINSKVYNYTGRDISSLRYEIVIGLNKIFLDDVGSQWNRDRQTLMDIVKLEILSISVLLISFIYLVLVAGKKSSDDEIHLNFIDKLLLTDLNISFIVISVYVFVQMLIENLDMIINHDIAIILLIPFVFSMFVILILSLVRHIKNKSFIKNSLIYIILSTIYRIIYNIYKFFRDLFFGGPLMIKAMTVLTLFTLACIIGTVFFPLIIFIFLVAVYLVVVYVKKFNLIIQIVKNIKSGDFRSFTTATVMGRGELASLASDIDSIAEGLDKAVKNEVKSQRMKSELISNVSHDIKTPLTSIINYVDLLKKEGMESENSSKYLDILEQKSQRLKVLTEDLFEAAKASSGDMPIEFEKIDIFSLIQQGLAELDDRIKESGLHFKVNIPDEKTYVMADGRLLWRVIENLLSNVFKYALKGSRVYIDVINDEKSDNVSLVIKNISSYELNVDVDELMERFKRADESRNSEGSGLGLAIAKDLMNMQKGSLNLEIDGDLFKAIVTIPKCEAKISTDKEPEEELEEIIGEIEEP